MCVPALAAAAPVFQAISAGIGIMSLLNKGDAPSQVAAAPAPPPAPEPAPVAQAATAPDEAARRQTTAQAQTSARAAGGGATGGGTMLTGPSGVSPDLLNLGRAGKNTKLAGQSTLLGA